MNFAEMVAFLLSLPMALWRSIAPRKFQADFDTYSIDGFDWADPEHWKLEISGEVEKELSFSWDELSKISISPMTEDFHCITGWSVLDVFWEGILWKDFISIVQPLPSCRFVRFTSHGGYSASFHTKELEGAMLAIRLRGSPLSHERGGPLRLVVPGLYALKNVKGLRHIHFESSRHLGFWEKWGYGPSGRIGMVDKKRINKARSSSSPPMQQPKTT